MALILSSISKSGKTAADVKYAIVRSYKNPVRGMVHMPELSPSWGLFKTYLDLRNKGQWNEQTYEQVYVPKFLREMQSAKARDCLNKLFLEAREKDVLIACYCPDERLCHRKIIGSLMKGAGCSVFSDTDIDDRYWTAYSKS